MSRTTTADLRLERLLYVLPAAMRDGGASLSELARALDTTEQHLLQDLDEVTSRVYYRPGGWPDDVQIQIEQDRVRVVHASGFERPTQLSRTETLCLALALRGTAASAHMDDAAARGRLLERAEAHLGRAVAAPAPGESEAGPAIGSSDLGPDPEGIRETLMVAARDRRACGLWSAKAGAADGSLRVVHPYAIAYGEGAWYAVAYCTVEQGIRIFRMDRVLAADLAEGSFSVPDDFDVSAYVQNGRVYHAVAEREARVRYSPRIASWIRERARWEPERMEDADDGSVVVRHPAADPHWVVGHALAYGAEAEVLEPEEIRALVRDVVREVVG